jgi:hypothetical protein
MRKIEVNKPTGYIGNNEVQIFDNKGRNFYSFKTNGEFKFNLPVGTYFTNSDFKECKKMHTYDFKRTRKRENYNYKEPHKVKVIFATNPNKASVFLTLHRIVIDPSFLKFPSYVVEYLISHEIGHYYYKTEEFCDEFAQERMLKRGFNKSQIAECSASTLGHGNERVKCCVDNLKKAKMK